MMHDRREKELPGEEVLIVGAARTPVGAFRGCLADFSAPQLGGAAIDGVIKNAVAHCLSGEKLAADEKVRNAVEAVYMGNVLQAGVGQAPARQAALLAQLPPSVACTTVNKVCASGLKAVGLGASDIRLGQHRLVVCGGMESMTQAPFLLGAKARAGLACGIPADFVQDAILRDGLHDPVHGVHMGEVTERCCVDRRGIDRQRQDAYAIDSYRRAFDAHDQGLFAKEIIPLTRTDGKTKQAIVIDDDEQYKRVDYDKLPKLRPSFRAEGVGTITAANASAMNDGASALLLCHPSLLQPLNLRPRARIVAYADAECDPLEFPMAPRLAIDRVLSMSGLTVEDIDYWEINEAFSAVVLANLDAYGGRIVRESVNVWGGAVSLGHAIGNSGSRLLVTLQSILEHYQARRGLAAICNGGGGATAMIIERLP
jgi:acetyl-CoA C-acetyltransferase